MLHAKSCAPNYSMLVIVGIKTVRRVGKLAKHSSTPTPPHVSYLNKTLNFNKNKRLKINLFYILLLELLLKITAIQVLLQYYLRLCVL